MKVDVKELLTEGASSLDRMRHQQIAQKNAATMVVTIQKALACRIVLASVRNEFMEYHFSSPALKFCLTDNAASRILYRFSIDEYEARDPSFAD